MFLPFTGELIYREHPHVLQKDFGITLAFDYANFGLNEDDIDKVARQYKTCNSAHVVDAHRYSALALTNQQGKRRALAGASYLRMQDRLIALQSGKYNTTTICKNFRFSSKCALGQGLSRPRNFRNILSRHRSTERERL